jgi:hypothetical protein
MTSWHQNVKCMVVHATNKTGPSSDDWIYWHLVTFTNKQYSAIVHLHHLQFTVAQALGLSLSTSRLLATDLNTQEL